MSTVTQGKRARNSGLKTSWQRTSSNARILLLTVLLTGLTTFMFLPLLAIQLSESGVAAGQVGLIVGLLLFSSQGFSLVIGLIIDHFRPRLVLGSGFVLRIIGYVLLGIGLVGGTHLAALIAGVVCIGAGGSILGLSTKTQLVREDSQNPREMLALRSTFVNVGAIAGPALGAIVYPLGFHYILLACICSHLLLGLLVAVRVTLPADAADSMPGPAAPLVVEPAALPSEGTRHSRQQWVSLFVVGVAFWTIYSQLYVVLPITAQRLTGNVSAISAVFTINGVLCVLFQYSLLSHAFARAATRTLLVLGFLAFAVAYIVLTGLSGWAALLAFVLPFTLAELLIGPSLDQQAIMANSRNRTGLALGTMSVAGSVGSLLGSNGGG